MIKFYVLAAVGAAFAASLDSILVLFLTIAIVLWLYKTGNINGS